MARESVYIGIQMKKGNCSPIFFEGAEEIRHHEKFTEFIC